MWHLHPMLSLLFMIFRKDMFSKMDILGQVSIRDQRKGLGLGVMVFSATFNNFSVISWRPVLLVEETGIPWEKTQTCHYHIMLYRVHLAWVRFELTNLVVIGNYCIGSCKSNYHTITTIVTEISLVEVIVFRIIML